MDILTKERRSWNMARIRPKNTKPGMVVRRPLYGLGYRYRLHSAQLIGKPDIVFSSRKKVIFVHGCFWHRHERCRFAYNPKTRKEFWQNKFQANVRRDREVHVKLMERGWQIMVVWECEVGNFAELAQKLMDFLENKPNNLAIRTV